MTEIDKTSDLHPPYRRSTRLRTIGIIVLVLGIGCAGTVYWLGTRSPNLSDDPSLLGFNRLKERQMGLLYGKMGTLIEDWTDELKEPGTQAEIIVAGSIFFAAGCFYFARLLEHDDKPR